MHELEYKIRQAKVVPLMKAMNVMK